MGAILPLLSTIFSGLLQPVKDYLNYKNQELSANRELKLAQIQADKEAIISGNLADTNQRQNYLNSVTQQFRQGAIIFFMVPFCISMIAPSYAKIMWANFYDIPADFRQFFFIVYGVILGLPLAKDTVSQAVAAMGRGLDARREYKAKINRAVVFAELINKWFPKGMNQAQVNELDKALDAGEESSN